MALRLLAATGLAAAVLLVGAMPISPSLAAGAYQAEAKQQSRILRHQRKAERRAHKQVQRQQRRARFAEQERRREAFQRRYGGRYDRFDDPFFDRRAYWNWRYRAYGNPFYGPYFGPPPWWW